MKFRLRKSTGFILFSILIHLGLWLSFYIKSNSFAEAPPRPVEIVYEEGAPPTLNKKSKSKKDTTKQIVEQDKRINEETPDKDFFLSQFNQQVVRQQRAKDAGAFRNKAEAQTAPKKKNITMADLVPGYGPKMHKQEDAATDSKKVTEGSRSDDYLKEVPTGLQTLLSTREFVFYAYYARVKEKIRQQWEPQVREKVKIVYRQGRNIASATDRITRVVVTLNSKGELMNVEVVTQSGVQHLDDAATGAFKAAAPFPNPPQGMVEQDGFVRIRWDFILEA